ncbi:MAG: VWA domain-containing protein [Sumerlaeia bacterium]
MEWRFLHPWFFLLAVLPLIALIKSILDSRKSSGAITYSDLEVFSHVKPSLKMRIIPFLPWVKFLALLLLVVALARPQYGQTEQLQSSEGIDISLVLDISETMDIEDYRPNRLEVAKKVMEDFVQERVNDRINVIIFGTSPYLLVPPTFDKPTIVNFLGLINGRNFSQRDRRTAIGSGLALAVDQLKDSDAESKVAILLTDGENNEGEISPLQAAEAAKALGVRVYTIGLIGSPSNSFWGGASQREINVNKAELTKMATLTGGQFFMARDSAALKTIYDQIDELEKSEIEVQDLENYAERFAWFAFPSLLLLSFDFLFRFLLLRRIP